MKLRFRLSGVAVFLAVAFVGQFLLGGDLMTVKDAPHGKALILEYAEQLGGDDNKTVAGAFAPNARQTDTSCYRIRASHLTDFHSWSLVGQEIHATGPPRFYS